jgi:peptide deformylase
VFEYEATGLTARCLCHETDHLNGVTITDLAEYFYNPEIPHDLDETITGGAGAKEGGEEEA